MRLADLILSDLQEILADFEEFARTHTGAGASMDVGALRDHAEEMLRAFAQDMGTAQTSAEQKRKSMGDAPVQDGAAETAAQMHGSDRAESGFTLDEMFAEYRALRASVLRHWMAARGSRVDAELQEMIRFNEAIDQAVAESITRYSGKVNDYREMFLAMLGHDLRTPLSAVLSASSFLTDNAGTPRNRQLAETIHRSGERMSSLVADMLDFTLSRLGQGIPVARASIDLGVTVRAVVDEVRLLHPNRDFRFETTGDLHGAWDARRVTQSVTNLVANAVQHGASDSTITIVVRGEDDDVVVAVRNRGNLIPPGEIENIFEPFRRRPTAGDGDSPVRSLGLGLHIAREIALAHGGAIDVESSTERGTTFFLKLPRRASAPQTT